MAIVSEDFDVKVRVVFPFLTKSLSTDDNQQINATGNFNFEPPPQVDTAQGLGTGESPVTETTAEDRAEGLKNDLGDLLKRFNRIQEAMKKRSQHIILRYDPELTENEALANAETDLFGVASGAITYAMYEQVIGYEEKVNKYISHLSIENEGVLNGRAAS